MYYPRNTYPTPTQIAGVKRQAFPTHISTQLENIHKKARLEPSNKLILEDVQSSKKPFSPQIPPLLLHNQTNINNNLHDITPNPFLLLNRARILQKCLQLLILKQYVEQQKNLFSAKRNISSSTCNSHSTSDTLSPMKTSAMAPIIIPTNETLSLMDIPKLASYYPNKSVSKISACKNYIALLCAGFARSVLTATPESEIMIHLHETILQKRAKYMPLGQRTQDDLSQFMIEHIHKDICGKRVKRMNKGRDFKVRNTKELVELLFPREGDSDLLKFRKEVLKEMLDYFFSSKSYFEWLEKGMINEANRNFFLKNKVEIRKKFNHPTLYKPHFDYN